MVAGDSALPAGAAAPVHPSISLRANGLPGTSPLDSCLRRNDALEANGSGEGCGWCEGGSPILTFPHRGKGMRLRWGECGSASGAGGGGGVPPARDGPFAKRPYDVGDG